MSKVTGVYITMLGAFAIGLWAILTTGSVLLQAPADLSGEWVLYPLEPSGGNVESPMHVEQSGRFFRVAIGTTAASMKLDSQTAPERPGASEVRVSGSGMRLLFTGDPRSGEMRLETKGVLDGQWLAVRTIPGRRPTRTPTAASKPAI